MHTRRMTTWAMANGESRARGFTLIEMLVTISIILIVLAITIPFIAAMSRMMTGGAGVNTINAAITSARGYATRKIGDQYVGTNYSGAAILFTPSGELRLIENFQGALNYPDGFPVEKMGPARNRYNAYQDIENRDYIALPSDTIVLGLTRTTPPSSTEPDPSDPSGDDTGLRLLAPPFAVRFDQYGQLDASVNMNGGTVVFYDAGPLDGLYDTRAGTSSSNPLPEGSDRQNPYDLPSRLFRYDASSNYHPYDPDYWNFNHAKFDSSVYVAGTGNDPGNYVLPFEGIETVAAVVVVSRRALEEEGLTLEAKSGTTRRARDGDMNDATKVWVLEWDTFNEVFLNAQVLYFSRYSGVVIRDNL